MFNGLEVRRYLRILLAQRLDATHCTDHCRMVAIAECATQFWKAALEPKPAQVHGDLTCKCNALVTVFAQQFGIGKTEVTANDPLNVSYTRWV